MKQPVFEGLATAIVTPFRNGTIDIPTFEKLLYQYLFKKIENLTPLLYNEDGDEK